MAQLEGVSITWNIVLDGAARGTGAVFIPGSRLGLQRPLEPQLKDPGPIYPMSNAGATRGRGASPAGLCSHLGPYLASVCTVWPFPPCY